MKTAITTLAFGLALVFSASAQETKTKTTPKAEKSVETRSSQERMDKTNMDQNNQVERVRAHVDRMSTDFNLTKDQKTRLEQHYMNVAKEQQTVGNVKEADADRVKINEKTKARYNSEIREILNEKQYAEYLERKDDYELKESNSTHGMTPNESMTPTDNRGSKERTRKSGGQHGTQPNPEN